MKDILKKLKILDEFSVELEIERSSFVRKMSDVVEPGTVSQFVPFEAFRASKKEYRGNVSDHEFRIRRQRRFFDSNRNWAVATGSLRQREANLIVDVEVSSFTYMFAFFYAFILIFYLVFVGVFIFNGYENGVLIIPFLILHAAFMLGIPYLFMRRSTNRMKYDLTRELHFLAGQK